MKFLRIKSLSQAVKDGLVRAIEFYDGYNDQDLIRFDLFHSLDGSIVHKQIGVTIKKERSQETLAINLHKARTSLNKYLRKHWAKTAVIQAPPIPHGADHLVWRGSR